MVSGRALARRAERLLHGEAAERAPGVRSLWSGEVVTATGDGRLPFVDVDDIAAVAAVALRAATPPDPELVIIGPEALGHDDVCRIWTDVTGEPARHVRVSEGELAARFTAAGVPADFAAVLAALDMIVASGAQAPVTSTVPALTGRPARSARRSPRRRHEETGPDRTRAAHARPPHRGHTTTLDELLDVFTPDAVG